MCSFHIKSLFTAVPLEETVNICAHALFDIKCPELSLTKKNFIKLLRLATSSVEFSANDQMYKQLDGVAMGSPLGWIYTRKYLCEVPRSVVTGKNE